MPATLRKPGKSTSAEVLGISPQGLWLLAAGKEYYLRHEDYPWFKNASVKSALNVKLLHGRHLHWPDLDVDLEVGGLEHPETYPLSFH